MAQTTPVGIDLGTTNSAVAYLDESGRTTMLRNNEGDTITPSVVMFDDTEVIVGKEARRLAAVFPDRVAEWVKRDMGQPVYSRPIRGEYLPPEVIQACILRRLKADILAKLGPAAKAVITVPAYFDEPRRKATADAGEMAGLTLLDIVNEPTAAALGFGENLGYLSPQGNPVSEMVVMVYDLGGGTFDATLLKLAPRDIRTLATDGDVQLGGHDWDDRLVNYAAEAFRKQYARDPREDPAARSKLFGAAVEAKHTLSARSHATIRVEHAGSTADVPITREKFEELTADLLERTAYTIRQLLSAAGLQWKQISRLLLVGGSTRMPMVTRMLQQLTGLIPDRTVNPDEAVARGAAIYANYLLASKEQGGPGAGFKVTNVNSHSLGIEGIEPETLRKINVILIPRNTPLPAKATERFMTKSEGQRSIVIRVLEGESRIPGECTAIGRTVLRDLPAGLPKGWPIEVTYEYGANGRLTVQGVVPGTHRQVVLDLERDVGLSSEGISRWKNAVGTSGGFDAFEGMLQEVLNLPAVSTGNLPPLNPAAGPRTSDRWDAGPASPVPVAGVGASMGGLNPPGSGPSRRSSIGSAPTTVHQPLPGSNPSPPVAQPAGAANMAGPRASRSGSEGLGMGGPQAAPLPNTPLGPIVSQPAPIFSEVVTGAPAIPSQPAPRLPQGAGTLPTAVFSGPLPVQSQPIPLFSPSLPGPPQAAIHPQPFSPAGSMAGPLSIAPGQEPPPAVSPRRARPNRNGTGTDETDEEVVDISEHRVVSQKSLVLRRILSVLGYVSAAGVGIGLGYLLIRWLFPLAHLPF
ncbi:MAG: Hsp70 family protein [Thermoguttaceae bacterium]